MEEEALEAMPALLPLDFFTLEADLHFEGTGRALSKKYQLPDVTDLLDEESFCTLRMAWNEGGIALDISFDTPFERCSFPNFAGTDAVELFFDTRDLKTTGFATRFCHHFLFLPQPVLGIQAQELTHFRTEDTHPLCDPSDLSVTTSFEKKAYEMKIEIPTHCLHGFDPNGFDRLGFTYRIHRCGGPPQHFALAAENFKLEQNPKLWATLKLCR